MLASAGQDKRVRLWKVTSKFYATDRAKITKSEGLLSSADSSESATNLFKKLVEMKERNSELDIVQEFSYYQDSRSFKLPQKYSFL